MGVGGRVTSGVQVTSNDIWTWLSDPGVGYTVRRAYRILTSGTFINHNVPLVSADLLWRKDIPLKVSVFAWRLFQNRLPTKVNLFRRGVIHNEGRNYVSVSVVQPNLLIIFSCYAISLVRFGDNTQNALSKQFNFYLFQDRLLCFTCVLTSISLCFR